MWREFFRIFVKWRPTGLSFAKTLSSSKATSIEFPGKLTERERFVHWDRTMLRNRILGVILPVLCMPNIFFASQSAVPKIDKQRLEAYVRYAEGFSPEVKMSIDDPAPSPFTGYYRVLVHLTAGTHKLDRLYYATQDGQQLINGNVWKLGESPFLDTLEHLPADGPSFG